MNKKLSILMLGAVVSSATVPTILSAQNLNTEKISFQNNNNSKESTSLITSDDFSTFGEAAKQADGTINLNGLGTGGSLEGEFLINLGENFSMNFDIDNQGLVNKDGYSFLLMPYGNKGSYSANSGTAGVKGISNSVFISTKFHSVVSPSTVTDFDKGIISGTTDSAGDITIENETNTIAIPNDGDAPKINYNLEYTSTSSTGGTLHVVVTNLEDPSKIDTIDLNIDMNGKSPSTDTDKYATFAINSAFQDAADNGNRIVKLNSLDGNITKPTVEFKGTVEPGETITYDYKSVADSTYTTTYEYSNSFSNPDMFSTNEIDTIAAKDFNINDKVDIPATAKIKTEKEFLADTSVVLSNAELNSTLSKTYQGTSPLFKTSQYLPLSLIMDVKPNDMTLTKDSFQWLTGTPLTKQDVLDKSSPEITDGHIKTSTNDEILASDRLTVNMGTLDVNIPGDYDVTIQYHTLDGQYLSKTVTVSVSDVIDTDGDEISDQDEIDNGLDPNIPNTGDIDGDGISDKDEVNTDGTDPLNPDTDGDGLDDGEEINTDGTNPLDVDTDDDEISDKDEIDNGLDPLVPNTGDTDGDGISDKDEVNTDGTDPLDIDTDNDGLNDGEEVDTNKTDPLDIDTDDDGISDKDEIDNGLDPLVPNTGDTDDDGISDKDEVNTDKTDPLNPDTDGDEISDKDEIDNGLDPLVPNTGDTDEDGLSDKDEVNTDGTNPLNPDTDGDGVSDKDELDEGTDPNDPSSVPGKVLADTGKSSLISLITVSIAIAGTTLMLIKRKLIK